MIASSSAEIALALEALRAGGASNAMLAGSGSCVFTLAENRDRIDAIRRRLSLPESYERFASAFAETPEWRS